MANIVMSIRQVLANSLAFTGSSYLFLRLSKDSIDKERKRHDLAIEQLQKVQVEWAQKWQERVDFINRQLMLEWKVETELNDAVREYHKVFHPCLENQYWVTFMSQATNSMIESCVYCFEYGWNWRSCVVLGRLNVISMKWHYFLVAMYV